MFETPTVQIQQLQLTIHSGTAMLVTDREGWINGGQEGLFAYDTRYVSNYALTIEGFAPRFLTAERPVYNCAILTYTNPQFQAGSVLVDPFSLFLKLSRVLDEDLHEAIEITSFVAQPVQFRLLVNLECSFDDIFEVRGLYRTPPRMVQARYEESSGTLHYTYRDDWFSRVLQYRILSADSQPRFSPNLLVFPVHLRPQHTWRAEITTHLTGEPLGRFFPATVIGPHGESHQAPLLNQSPRRFEERVQEAHTEVERWLGNLPRIQTPNRTVQRAYEQAIRDLAALRLQRVGDEWYPAAGVPWYNCLFGRDALITALECLPLGCPFPRAVLSRLAELQGTQVNPWNDEEPGKILHELRAGQLSLMGKIPYNPFYATVDAPLLYVILLAEAYRFSGDRRLLEQFLGPAERCLQWAAEYGDIDGDGFLEYWMRSPHDYHNQAWKDARDAVVYPEGAIVPDPIAIVDVQGYYYHALCSAVEIYRILGDTGKADAAERRAERLFHDFNERYWLPDEQFYAYGLDPAKRPVRTIVSNPGQLLWTRIVPKERAACLARRLLADDLWSGWGVRTLSTQNGAYAPVMYQRGSIWPHDNAIIAFGLKRAGHWQAANRIAEGIFAASGYFAHGQLPELWAGLDRQQTIGPVLYPEANVPQAWAAGSIPLLLRAMLGIEADVDRHRLLIQPTLPEWLDDLTIRGLRFREGSVDLRLTGTGLDTKLEVLRTSDGITVEHQSVATEGTR